MLRERLAARWDCEERRFKSSRRVPDKVEHQAVAGMFILLGVPWSVAMRWVITRPQLQFDLR